MDELSCIPRILNWHAASMMTCFLTECRIVPVSSPNHRGVLLQHSRALTPMDFVSTREGKWRIRDLKMADSRNRPSSSPNKSQV